MSQKYASFAAKDTREASSLPSDFDAPITAFKFTKEAPDGYSADGNPIFAVVTLVPEGDGQPPEVVQSYNLGGKAGDEFSISEDGYGLIPTGSETTGRKGSKFDLFKCSLENEGVSSSIFEEGDFSKILGIRAHWKRIDDAKLLGKEREFQNARQNDKKSKFPPQTLVCVKLLDVKASTGKAATTTQATASAAASTNDGATLEQKAATYLKKAIAASKGGVLPRNQIVLAVSKAAGASDPDRAAVAKLAADEGFLGKLRDEGMMVGDDPFQVLYNPAANPQVVTAV